MLLLLLASCFWKLKKLLYIVLLLLANISTLYKNYFSYCFIITTLGNINLYSHETTS